MKKYVKIFEKIKPFNKSLKIEGDKSLSIRWALLASQALGKSTSFNLLRSEDVFNTLNCLKRLGIKVKLFKNKCEIISNGLNSFKYKKNVILDAGNSGTTARLLCSVLIDSNKWIKITGDKSLKKRDMERIIKPLKLFGVKFKNKSKTQIGRAHV